MTTAVAIHHGYDLPSHFAVVFFMDQIGESRWPAPSGPAYQYFREHGQLVKNFEVAASHAIESLADRIHECHGLGGTVWIAGNGGSAAAANHMATDLGRYASKALARPINAISLCHDMVSLTALANDEGYEHVFSHQLRAGASAGDVFLALSFSGESENCIEAAKVAHAAGVSTYAWSGLPGGRLAILVDHALIIPTRNILLCEDVHVILHHALAHTIASQSDSIDGERQ